MILLRDFSEASRKEFQSLGYLRHYARRQSLSSAANSERE